jgi:hypothetical protein
MTLGKSKGNVRTVTIMVRPEEGDDVVRNTFSFFPFCSKPVYYILSLEKHASLFQLAVSNRYGAKEFALFYAVMFDFADCLKFLIFH